MMPSDDSDNDNHDASESKSISLKDFQTVFCLPQLDSQALTILGFLRSSHAPCKIQRNVVTPPIEDIVAGHPEAMSGDDDEYSDWWVRRPKC